MRELSVLLCLEQILSQAVSEGLHALTAQAPLYHGLRAKTTLSGQGGGHGSGLMTYLAFQE